MDKSRARKCLARSWKRAPKREDPGTSFDFMIDGSTSGEQWSTKEALTHEGVIFARDPAGRELYRLKPGRSKWSRRSGLEHIDGYLKIFGSFGFT